MQQATESKTHPYKSKTQVFDFDKWTGRLPALKEQYQQASPYPHIVLDDFMEQDNLDACAAEFDKLQETDGWINYVHYNERKKGLNKLDMLPAAIRQTRVIFSAGTCCPVCLGLAYFKFCFWNK